MFDVTSQCINFWSCTHYQLTRHWATRIRPGVIEPSGKMMCCGIKVYSANVVSETQCAH